MRKVIAFSFAVLLPVLGVCKPASAAPGPHQVTILSGDITADPQTLTGTVGGGKASVSGPYTASFNFAKWQASGACSGETSHLTTMQAAQPLSATGVFAVGGNPGSEVTLKGSLNGKRYEVKIVGSYTSLNVSETSTDMTVESTGGMAYINMDRKICTCSHVADLSYRIQK